MPRQQRFQLVSALCLAALANFVVSPVPAFAGNQAVRDIIEEAINGGWKASPTKRIAAQELLEQAMKQAPNDVRVRFANALILIRNHAPKQAAHELDLALIGGGDLIPIRKVRIYVAVLTGDYAAATQESQALAHILEGSADNELHREAAEFLGTVVGYLHHVKGSKAEGLAELEREVASSLSGSLAEAYAEGQESVADLAASLDEELLAAREHALVRETDAKANKLNALGDKLATTQAQAARIGQERQEFQSQNGQRYLAATQFVQMAPYLVSQLRQQRDNPFMFTSQPSTPRSYGKHKDDDDRLEKHGNHPHHGHGAGMSVPFSPAQIDLQIAAVNYRYAESVAFIANCNAKMNSLANQANRIGCRQKMQERSQRAFERIKADHNDGRTSSLVTTRKAFNTYVSNLLEAERDRLLATYDVK